HLVLQQRHCQLGPVRSCSCLELVEDVRSRRSALATTKWSEEDVVCGHEGTCQPWQIRSRRPLAAVVPENRRERSITVRHEHATVERQLTRREGHFLRCRIYARLGCTLRGRVTEERQGEDQRRRHHRASAPRVSELWHTLPRSGTSTRCVPPATARHHHEIHGLVGRAHH